MYNIPFKFGQNISHKNPAFHSPVNSVVVFKECKHVSAVLHCQTSDKLFHHLDKTMEEDKISVFVHIKSNNSDILEREISDILSSNDYSSLTSPAVVCELMEILQEPPPWQ